ncbi:hypothetical protein ROA7745_03587 [Roseovarius aestuarii]|uniref:Uncharacterized protein n=1 Tax=Roseovarius aestuarii TaxID=475083 RepID=A0A1X7BVS2_9RHOB|nr:hypothetical protein ROA7745_03587 [Roseovarius aestuarii]
MSKLENVTAELCDQLMIEASSGDLNCIKNTVAMLIEYSACELARHKNSEASILLLDVAKEFERTFPREKQRHQSIL